MYKNYRGKNRRNRRSKRKPKYIDLGEDQVSYSPRISYRKQSEIVSDIANRVFGGKFSSNYESSPPCLKK